MSSMKIVSYMFRTSWVHPHGDSCICSYDMFCMHRCEQSDGQESVFEHSSFSNTKQKLKMKYSFKKLCISLACVV